MDNPSSSQNDKSVRKHQNTDANSIRNRMMANIQANLGGKLNQPKTVKRRPQKTVDSFKSVEDMLEKLKLANDDMGVSVSDIRPYLIENAEDFTCYDFEIIVDSFCDSALTHMNIHFIIELCVILIKYKDFQTAMSLKLDELISKYILNSDDKLEAIPALLATVLTTKWPRPYHKAIEASNTILFSVISAIMGWLMVINENVSKNSNVNNEETSETKNLEMVLRCGKALCEMCNTGQRGLWMSFPTLLDEIFESFRNLLISELPISKSLRQSLLQVYVSIFKWTSSNTRTMVSVSTQTLIKPF